MTKSYVVYEPEVEFSLDDMRLLIWGFNASNEVSCWTSVSRKHDYVEGDKITLQGANAKLHGVVIINDDDGVLVDLSGKFEMDGLRYNTLLDLDTGEVSFVIVTD
jgi:hypothetical protein